MEGERQNLCSFITSLVAGIIALAVCCSLLGGIVGLGTLICMLLVGPVAGVFLPLNGRWIDALVQRLCGTNDEFT